VGCAAAEVVDRVKGDLAGQEAPQLTPVDLDTPPGSERSTLADGARS
jgi:hypothetical protein